MPRANELRTGEIYWFEGCPPIDGDEEKGRPVLVFTLNEDLSRNPQVIEVVPVSCSNRDHDRVPIPNLSTDPRQTLTDLPRECWAIPRRIFRVNADLLGEPRGHIRAGRLTQLQLAVAKRAEEGAPG